MSLIKGKKESCGQELVEDVEEILANGARVLIPVKHASLIESGAMHFHA
jgi:hypothetical protein